MKPLLPVLLLLFVVACQTIVSDHESRTVAGLERAKSKQETKLEACLAISNRAFEQSPRIVSFPGNQNFENHFYKNVSYLVEDTNLNPKVFIYDDRVSPNAMALNYSYGHRGRYTILFGEQMLTRLVFPTRQNPRNLNTIEMLSVLAHEFGHIAQYQRGLLNYPVKKKELMADAISGWWVARVITRFGELEIHGNLDAVPNVRRAMIRTYSLGDFQYNSRDHHGTPNERLEAFAYGVSLVFNRTRDEQISDFDNVVNLTQLRYLY